MNRINISENKIGRIILASPYDPLLVAKAKTISNHRLHPDVKYWSFPTTDGTLEKILKVFGIEEIHLDPRVLFGCSSALSWNYYLSGKSQCEFQGIVPLFRLERNGHCTYFLSNDGFVAVKTLLDLVGDSK